VCGRCGLRRDRLFAAPREIPRNAAARGQNARKNDDDPKGTKGPKTLSRRAPAPKPARSPKLQPISVPVSTRRSFISRPITRSATKAAHEAAGRGANPKGRNRMEAAMAANTNAARNHARLLRAGFTQRSSGFEEVGRRRPRARIRPRQSETDELWKRTDAGSKGKDWLCNVDGPQSRRES
jgi:hypothetical protein